MGTGQDTALGYDEGEDEGRIVDGNNVATDANVLISWNSQAPIFKSSTTVGLQGTTPKKAKGEYYLNSDTGAIWVSSNTSINAFWHYSPD